MIPIRLNKSAEFISLRGKLIFTTIYADKDEIDHVYAPIRQSCVNLKNKTWQPFRRSHYHCTLFVNESPKGRRSPAAERLSCFFIYSF